MKITYDDNKIIIYVNKYIIKDYKYSNTEEATKEILNIILKTSNIYNISFTGLYKVEAYQNKKLGILLEISKYDDLDMIDYTDFRIKIYNEYPFLLEFNDYFDIPSYYKPICYKDKYYLHIKDITNNDLLKYSDIYALVYKNVKLITNFKME